MPVSPSAAETPPRADLALSVVVPCHNEEATLPLLASRLTRVCAAVAPSFEILLVDDGSTDATWALMNQLAAEDPRLRGVRLARRYGQQIALSAGLSLCRGARVFILDADLQDPPELLPDMMRLMDGGADVVYGQRRRREGESAFKRATAGLFYRFLRRVGETDLPVDAGDFRLINRRVWTVLQDMPERQRYLRGMVAWIGLRQVPLPYDREPRPAGTSHYSLGRMANLAMDALSGFSVAPLRLGLWAGVFCAALAGALLLYVLGSWALGSTVSGWTSLACIVLFFSGVQLFCIGLIGEYVGRLYLESKKRPLFVIDRVTGADRLA